MFCRFEDRLAGRALQLEGPRDRIEARSAAGLKPALDAIEAARRQGRWVALMIDFEVGEWLQPTPASQPASLQEAAGETAGAAAGEATHGGGQEGAAEAATDAATEGAVEGAAEGVPESAIGDASAAARHARRAAVRPAPRLRALVFDTMREDRPWTSPAVAAGGIVDVAPRMTQADYVPRIQAIRAGIERGAYYQVNYTMPLDVRVDGDLRALYAGIAQRNPVAHGAYIEDGGETILSFSPELFVTRRGATLTTRPMKGTAPRDADPERDEALGRELQASAKNRAENLMIVDLLRNDLGRIARTGSVRAQALFTLERYPTVWTLTSTVTAQAPDASLEDVLRALFPCGSVTGAPKLAALSHIRRTEIAPRGLYCGSIGWLAPDGDFSLNVAIRTLVVDEAGQGVYGVGGGIVHDSDPYAEWQECLWKARILDPARKRP
jgi:para-aminobenzoate synthetase component 1